MCSIVFNAVYPTLSVTSVLGDGSLSHLSKSRLWNMLYIDKLVVSMIGLSDSENHAITIVRLSMITNAIAMVT